MEEEDKEEEEEEEEEEGELEGGRWRKLKGHAAAFLCGHLSKNNIPIDVQCCHI